MILLTGDLYDIISSVNRRLRNLKMAKKVKDYYDLAYARDLSRRLQEASPAFDGQKFRLLLEKDLEELELASVKNSWLKVSKIAFPYLIRTLSRFLRKF